MYTNDGLKLVEMMPQNTGANTGIELTVDKEGFMRLPTVGNIQVKDLTIREVQTKLEKAYSEFYIKPFVLLRVVNRRALVFPGNGGAGTVVNLKNESTSLLEVLALAGGISTNGKAHRVKLVRGNISNPEIQLIDLSTIEGMKKANITIQANDIVYIDPVRNISQGVLSQIAPLLALLTTALFLAQLANK
jgi:polysaccharide biosynthesis/export protein